MDADIQNVTTEEEAIWTDLDIHDFVSACMLAAHASASTTMAMPCPPPMQAVAKPYFFFRRRNS